MFSHPLSSSKSGSKRKTDHNQTTDLDLKPIRPLLPDGRQQQKKPIKQIQLNDLDPISNNNQTSEQFESIEPSVPSKKESLFTNEQTLKKGGNNIYD